MNCSGHVTGEGMYECMSVKILNEGRSLCSGREKWVFIGVVEGGGGVEEF